ncbi:MAG: membrane protein insertase YidC [Verrucomicrobiota bacterium]|nr:membrane protein insertase YidC [Verrucomicrobiota bacterium]
MDRTAWVAIALCAIGLVLWEFYVVKQTVPKPTTANAPGAPISPAATPVATVSAAPVAAESAPTPAPQPTETAPPFQEITDTLRNADFELQLTNRGGGVKQVVLLNHTSDEGNRLILNSPNRTPIGAIIENPAAPLLPEYKMTRQGDAVQFERAMPEQITIRKKFFLPQTSEKKDNFLAELDVDLVNGSGTPYVNSGYFIALGSATANHPQDYPSFTRLVWCINGTAKGVDVDWFSGKGGILGMGQRTPQPFYQENIKGAEWVAVSNQFFTTLIAPLNGKAEMVSGRRFDTTADQKIHGIEGAMRMPGFQLQPGQTYSARFEIYSGPKIYHRLSLLEHNEAEIMDFGIFKIVCQFLLNALNSLHSVLGTYGAAILALTTIIKLVLWPLQTKANRSMRQTSLLAPKVQELREKYKDDPTRMNQEVMKMYKEYGINPVGGCLPMVIQIPIFFGLFTMLRQAVELRHSSFLWVRDLSQPDTVAHLPVLGWPINIIPLCMAATQVWLMQMTPKTGDATQRRVMMFTPLIFLFFCYNFAAALALYYTAQNLLSIVQFYHNKRQPAPTLERLAAAKRKR